MARCEMFVTVYIFQKNHYCCANSSGGGGGGGGIEAATEKASLRNTSKNRPYYFNCSTIYYTLHQESFYCGSVYIFYLFSSKIKCTINRRQSMLD